MAWLIIVCGLPGSGKTTVARRIALATGAMRCCPDEWMQAAGISLWDEVSRARLEAAQWVEAQAQLTAGRDVVIEWGTWAKSERDALRDWCRAHDVAVSLVHLEVPVEELRRRLTERNALPGETVIPPELLDEWIAGPWHPPGAEELATFDPFEVPRVGYVSRRWGADDVPFLWEVLHLSIHVKEGWEQPPRSILDDHALAHYLRDFGRWEGDDAQLICTDLGEPVAAAFCRRMRADDPGWGFVEEGVPEFGMAVVPEHRGRGLGRRVLTDLLARHPLMSLSVDFDNHVAKALYDSLGFVAVGDDGNSLTMIRRPGASHDRDDSGARS